MGLYSFSYGMYLGQNTIPEEVLGLLNGASMSDREFETEIIAAGMQGNIDFDKPFNLKGYNHAIRRNIRLNECERKDNFYLTFDENEVDSDRFAVLIDSVASNGISWDSFTSGVKSSYEKVDDDLTLEQTIKQIKELNTDMLVFEHIDLIATIEGALKGITDCIETVKRVVEKYSYVGAYIRTILSSGKSFNELLESV